MFVIAGFAILTVAANALIFDGQITIDRDADSPNLTVHYTNASATLVELLVNGESVATRNVTAGKTAGDVSFTLNLASLVAGDNKIEVRLFDKSGKQLGSETSTITAENAQGAVYLTNPKMGATLQGNVDIKVGFGHQMKNSYVSFFIDNQFKSISNVPPFEFNWDTSRDSNGWHEVEAWVVDEHSSTFKTKKIRVFVQNESGRTDRVEPRETPQPTPLVAGTVSNPVHAAVGNSSGLKPLVLNTTPPSVSTGMKQMMPTQKRLALTQHPTLSTIHNTSAALAIGKISITKGQRLPNLGSFAIVFNTQFVNFDVQPRVSEDGVPLTPFRYLIEKAGGKVDWANRQKNVSAKADGHDIFLHIGDAFALINKQKIDLEKPSFIDSGRTIVPLSFMRDALNVNIDYDKATNHVLITSIKK